MLFELEFRDDLPDVLGETIQVIFKIALNVVGIRGQSFEIEAAGVIEIMSGCLAQQNVLN